MSAIKPTTETTIKPTTETTIKPTTETTIKPTTKSSTETTTKSTIMPTTLSLLVELGDFQHSLGQNPDARNSIGILYRQPGGRNPAKVAKQLFMVIPVLTTAVQFLECLLEKYRQSATEDNPHAWEYAHRINGEALHDTFGYKDRDSKYIGHLMNIMCHNYTDDAIRKISLENAWVVAADRETQIKKEKSYEQDRFYKELCHEIKFGKVEAVSEILPKLDRDYLVGPEFVKMCGKQASVSTATSLLLKAANEPFGTHGQIFEAILDLMSKLDIPFSDSELFGCWFTSVWQRHSVEYCAMKGMYTYRRTPATRVLMKKFPQRIAKMTFSQTIKQLWKNITGKLYFITRGDMDTLSEINLKWKLEPMDNDFVKGPGYVCFIRHWRWVGGNSLVERGLCLPTGMSDS